MESNRRKWLGGALILIAAGMLVLGQTVLRERLQGYDFVLYWIACLVFTGLAAITALRDLFVIRFESKQRQRELVHETLNAVDREQREKDRSPGKKRSQKRIE